MTSKGIYKGLESIILENEYLRVEFLPKYGSKMASLISKKTGREFLFQSNLESLRVPNYGDAFNLYDSSGFDEVFPSIDSTIYPDGKYKGVEIPDHGEVWALPWEFEINENDKENGNNESVKFEVTSPKLPYRLSKIIYLDGNKIKTEYKVYNLNSEEEFKFIWTPHSLLKCDVNTKIIVPERLNKIITVEHSTEHLGEWGTIRDYPITTSAKTNQMIDMSRVEPISANNCEKFYFTNKLKKEEISGIECLKTGEKLIYRYDTDKIPYLGIWKTQGGYRGDYNIALEPCTGIYDDLYVANKIRKVASIEASGIYEWNFDIEII